MDQHITPGLSQLEGNCPTNSATAAGDNRLSS
jgi:hypothetical protein